MWCPPKCHACCCMHAPYMLHRHALVLSDWMQKPMSCCCFADQKQSLLVDMQHLASYQPDICIWLHMQPDIVLGLLHEVANEAVLLHYTDYKNTHRDIFVRVEASVEDKICDLRYCTKPETVYTTAFKRTYPCMTCLCTCMSTHPPGSIAGLNKYHSFTISTSLSNISNDSAGCVISTS